MICDPEATEVLLGGPGQVTQNLRGDRYAIDLRAVMGSTPEAYARVVNDVILARCDTKDRVGPNGPRWINALLTIERPGAVDVQARVHVACPPVVDWPTVTVAKKGPRLTLADMVGAGSLNGGMAEFLAAATHARLNTVISGPMGHGKTTLLMALADEFDLNDRVIQIEDSAELPALAADTVRMHAPPGTPAGDPEWVAEALLNTLRQRGTRIVLGEARGPEFAAWLWAANACASGSLTTLHAESGLRALDKMVYFAAQARHAPDERMIRHEVAAIVDLVIQVALVDKRYLISGIQAINPSVYGGTGAIGHQTLFTYRADAGAFTGEQPQDWVRALFAARAVHLSTAWFEPGPDAAA